MNLENRIARLEKLMLPAPEWEITAEFSDGHIENMSAKRFCELKRNDPSGIHIVDRVITSNTKELSVYLQAVKATALYVDENHIDDDIIYI